MATITDVIAEVVQEVNDEVVSVNDRKVIANIDGILRELKGAGVSGKDFNTYSSDELSRIAGSLSALMFNLGDMIAKSIRNQRVNEEVVSYKKANLREPLYQALEKQMEHKPTQDDVKAAVTKQVFRENLRVAFKEEHSQKLQHLWWATKGMLEAITQRIKILESAKAAGKYLDEGGDFIPLDPGLSKEDEEKALDSVPEQPANQQPEIVSRETIQDETAQPSENN